MIDPPLRDGVERGIDDSADDVLAERASAASSLTIRAVAPKPCVVERLEDWTNG
jgi:hypothetical protein